MTVVDVLRLLAETPALPDLTWGQWVVLVGLGAPALATVGVYLALTLYFFFDRR